MMFFARIQDHVRELSRKVPLTYYAFLLILVAGIVWSIVPVFILIARGSNGNTAMSQVVTFLFLLLLIPEYFMLRAYLALKSSTVDIMNVTFLIATILHIIVANWAWVVVIVVFWYVLSDFIRFREFGGQYVFKD